METHTGRARPAARLTVLTGPSGVGRHRLVELVRARTPAVWVPVPVTTRPRRPGEREGVDYHFLDLARFRRLRSAGQLLDWLELAGYGFGTASAPIESRLRAGTPVLLPVDPAGARLVARRLPEARLVWLRPPGAAGAPALAPAPGPPVVTVTVSDRLERVAEELVGLLGLPALL